MLRLRILDILKEQQHSKYWLYKQMDLSYQNFNKMVKNETSSIQIARIEILCQLLDCTPNELFIIDWEK